MVIFKPTFKYSSTVSSLGIHEKKKGRISLNKKLSNMSRPEVQAHVIAFEGLIGSINNKIEFGKLG